MMRRTETRKACKFCLPSALIGHDLRNPTTREEEVYTVQIYCLINKLIINILENSMDILMKIYFQKKIKVN